MPDPDASPSSEVSEQPVETPSGLARWQKGLLGLAIVMTVLGGGLKLFAGGRSADRPQTIAERSTDIGPTSTLVPSKFGPSGSTTAPQTNLSPQDLGWDVDDWSSLSLNLGFSFFAGFCIGYVARTFLKIAALICGLALLAVFGLEYAGVTNIDWTAVEGHFGSIIGWLKAQTNTFKDFVTGRLASTGSAAFGMFVGFRKG